jgi:PAS domain S-box-containing protein
MANDDYINEGHPKKSLIAEGRLLNILDKMIEGLQILDFDWRYIYVNEALVKQSHYTREELVGYTVLEKYPGVENTEVFRAMKACMESRTSHLMETEFEFPDGTKTWFELSIQPVEEGISILSVDITARRHAEERLRAREAEYRSLIEQATDGIFISDKNGKYIDVNLSACRMLGYSRDELLKMSVHDLLIKEEVKSNPIRFDVLKEGKTLLTTRNLKRKDGTVMPVEINSKMLSSGMMLGIVRDISKRRKAEEKIKSSEEKFRKLTETAFDAIILMDESGNIIFWNRGAELIFGYRKSEVLNKPLTIIMPDKYREAHTGGLQRFLKTGMKKVIGRVIEMEGQKKNGDLFPIEISITSWRSGDEGIFSGIIRDISERKQGEERIIKLNQSLEQKVLERTEQLERKIQQQKESEEKFQKAFQASAAGISITHLSDSSFLDVNDAFCKMLGFTKEELVGHTSLELGIVTNTKLREELLKQVREQGAASQFEMTVRSRSGKILDVLASVVIILLNGEKYALSLIYDITERKKAEQQLESANRELEAFSYSVSHDLRAPLRSIIGYSQIIEEDLRDNIQDSTKRSLSIIQKNAARMNRLIDDLLEFSKLDTMELKKSKVGSEQVVESCISTITNLFKHKAKVTVKRLYDVYADPEMLSQVWINLISNALKYSSKKAQPQVEIGAEKTENEVIFYVKDNGAGFDMQYAHKLFGVFQRLHRSEDFEGTGIGLSLAKRIITKHGGRIWAEGMVNYGATFYFSLPIP